MADQQFKILAYVNIQRELTIDDIYAMADSLTIRCRDYQAELHLQFVLHPELGKTLVAYGGGPVDNEALLLALELYIVAMKGQ